MRPEVTLISVQRRLAMPRFAVEATEWRKRVAHGVSRGLSALFEISPGGAAEKPRSFTNSLSPLRGLFRSEQLPTAGAVGYSLTPFHG